MKKLMAILLACMTLTCTLASCGDEDDESSRKSSKKSSSVVDEDENEDEDDEDDEEEEEETTKRKRRSGSKSESEDEEETEEEIFAMPDLIGMDYDETQDMYGDMLDILVQETDYSDYDENVIYDQSVRAGDDIKKGDKVYVYVSKGKEKEEETTAAPAIVSTEPLTVTSDSLLLVDASLFGKSHDEIEDILGADLGAPEDFPWWDAHQTLYYYVKGGVTYLLFFNDYDELDVVQLDLKIPFDMNVVNAAKAEFGIEPDVSEGNHSDIYEFWLADDSLNLVIYEEQYSETLEYWFRQSYMSGLYYG